MSHHQKPRHHSKSITSDSAIVTPPRPTPNEVAQYFESTYGGERLYFTVVPFRNDSDVNASTFAADNFQFLQPWLAVQTAKLFSGRIDAIAMVVRVFDLDKRIEIAGTRGKINIPEKELYMFRFDRHNTIGLDPDQTCNAFCTDSQTGAKLPLEKGLRFGSGQMVIDIIRGIAEPDLAFS